MKYLVTIERVTSYFVTAKDEEAAKDKALAGEVKENDTETMDLEAYPVVGGKIGRKA